MASNSGWDKTVPSGTSSIAQGDDDMRSTKSSMQAWWEQEHYATDGSANSAGVHKLGSGRVFMGASPSALSNPTGDNNGRLMHTTSTNGLWIADGSNSTWTLVTNGITEASTLSWTGANSFLTNKISVLGAFDGMVSHSSTLASDTAIAAAATTGILMVNLDSALTTGDIILPGWTDTNGTLIASASVRSSDGSVLVNFSNRGSVTTIPASTDLRYIGFPTLAGSPGF